MKVVQIRVEPATEGALAVLYALTDDGEIFRKLVTPNDERPWRQIKSPTIDDVFED